MRMRHAVCCTILLVLAAEGSTAYADTLMRGNHPVLIGKGENARDYVKWTNCQGTESATFKRPRYWVDKSDNCEMRAQDFGIEEKNGQYIVVDAMRLGKYFPGVRNGDVASFKTVNGDVELAANGQTLLLRSTVGLEVNIA